MGEPYDADDCPACGSINTGSYNSQTALMQGFGSRCYDCLAIWDFPGLTEDDPVCRSLADMIFPVPQRPLQPNDDRDTA